MEQRKVKRKQPLGNCVKREFNRLLLLVPHSSAHYVIVWRIPHCLPHTLCNRNHLSIQIYRFASPKCLIYCVQNWFYPYQCDSMWLERWAGPLSIPSAAICHLYHRQFHAIVQPIPLVLRGRFQSSSHNRLLRQINCIGKKEKHFVLKWIRGPFCVCELSLHCPLNI